MSVSSTRPRRSDQGGQVQRETEGGDTAFNVPVAVGEKSVSIGHLCTSKEGFPWNGPHKYDITLKLRPLYIPFSLRQLVKWKLAFPSACSRLPRAVGHLSTGDGRSSSQASSVCNLRLSGKFGACMAKDNQTVS